MSSTLGNEPTQPPVTRESTSTTTASGVRGSDVDESRSKQTRQDVVAEQKSQFGGFKWGSAFFGWLTATGTAVILIALLAAAGTVAGMPNNAKKVTDEVTTNAKTIGIAGVIALLVILFIAYLAGGYVAGRMARFNGLKQGIAVWLWALLIAVVIAILGVVAGDKYNVTDSLNNFPKIPLKKDDLTGGGILALVAIAVTSLVGAMLGGLAGMRFHRKVDKAGYTG